MTWVFLDDKFHSNPKVLAMGNAGAGLYARALAYCGDHLTDGFVPDGWAKSAASKALRERLTEVGAWSPTAGGYQIPDYLKLNPSRTKVLAKREERKQAGEKGARKRWNKPPKDGKTDGNSHGNTYGSTDSSPHTSLHGPQPPEVKSPPSGGALTSGTRATDLRCRVCGVEKRSTAALDDHLRIIHEIEPANNVTPIVKEAS